MKSKESSALLVCTTTFALMLLTFSSCSCKTVSSSVPTENGKVSSAKSLVYSLARSFASEAISELQESAQRNPRFGFNITMLQPQNRNGTLPGSDSDWLTTTTQLGVIGLKGGLLGLKAAIIQAVVGVLFVIFLIAGIAYFACNIGVISCSNVGGSLSNLGGGLGGNQYGSVSRSMIDYPQGLHRTTSAVYNAIEDGQKKYL